MSYEGDEPVFMGICNNPKTKKVHLPEVDEPAFCFLLYDWTKWGYIQLEE